MNIQEVKESSLKTIKNNFKQLQVLCTKIFKISPQSNEVLMARDVAKYISCIGLGVNPSMVDANTDTVINEFFQQTKLLTDFTRIKTLPIYEFCTGNVQTLRACFYVYFAKRIESLKSYDSLFYFDEKPAKKKSKFWEALKSFGKSKFEEAKSKGIDYATEKGVDAAAQFGDWLANETGIGQGEGNGKNSGGQIYYTYKFFPNGEYSVKTQPIKEDISANYKKEWIKIIEKEAQGLNFNETQYYFEKLFPKIHAGYYKTQTEMYTDMVKLKASEQNAALNKLTQKTNPIKGFLKSIGL
jgi:hypothetical protein